jgi:hypothetical protein
LQEKKQIGAEKLVPNIISIQFTVLSFFKIINGLILKTFNAKTKQNISFVAQLDFII